MSFLLDTDVVSELRKPSGRAERSVVTWASSHEAHSLYLSVITVMEIEVGVARVERRDSRQGNSLRAWLHDQVLSAFANRILPVDLPAARRAATLHVPDPRPDRDAMIAGTALAHGLTVVSRNVSDFEPMGVGVVNPWET